MGEWYLLDSFTIVWVILAIFIACWFKNKILSFFIICSPIILFQGIRIFFEGLMMNYDIFIIGLGILMMIIGGSVWISFITTKV